MINATMISTAYNAIFFPRGTNFRIRISITAIAANNNSILIRQLLLSALQPCGALFSCASYPDVQYNQDRSYRLSLY